jgi:hypothetical protein
MHLIFLINFIFAHPLSRLPQSTHYYHGFMVSIVGFIPRYQVGSSKVDTSERYFDEWQKKLPNTDEIRKSKPRSRYFTISGVELSPDNMAVATVYFVQGVLGLARLAVSFYLKDDLHLDPAEVCVPL